MWQSIAGGVRLIEEREKRLTALDAAIARGIADAEAGRVKRAREVGYHLIAKYRATTNREVNLTTIGMTEARRQLEELVERAVKGETIVISKWGKPTVRLVPLDASAAASTGSVSKKA